MPIEQVSESIRRAAEALHDLDVTDLSSPDVCTALRELRSERSLSSRLELALTARAAELHHSGTGDDPIDLLTGVGAMPQRRARQVLGHTELLARMPVLGRSVACGHDHRRSRRRRRLRQAAHRRGLAHRVRR